MQINRFLLILCVMVAASAPAHSGVVSAPPFTGAQSDGFESYGAGNPMVTTLFGGQVAVTGALSGITDFRLLATTNASCSGNSVLPRTGTKIGIDSNALFTGGWRFDFAIPVTEFGGYAARTCDWFTDVQVDIYDQSDLLVASLPFSASAGGSGSWNWFGVQANAGTVITAVEIQGIGSPISIHGVSLDDLQMTEEQPVPVETSNWGRIKAQYR